jgi:hypothetical protein
VADRRVRIEDDRREWNKLKRRIKKANRIHVVAGITHEPGPPVPGGPTVAEYASINELGLGVPARPFMAHFYDTSEPYIFRFVENAFTKYIAGNVTLEMALNATGLMMQKGIKKSIQTAYQWALPNADYTHLKKMARGRWNQRHAAVIGPNMGTKPLIDYGIMLNSVTFEIRQGMIR